MVWIIKEGSALIISTSSHNILLTSDLDDQVARMLRNRLDRLSEDILSIDVYMHSVASPGVGTDKKVVLRIHLRNRKQLMVEITADDLHSALRCGARRAKRSVRQNLDKPRRFERLHIASRLANRRLESLTPEVTALRRLVERS
jgi:hypothetical protein